MHDIAVQRLYNQQLEQTKYKTPGEIVAWLGAVQAQEYYSAKWALGLRLPGVKDVDIEQAFEEGTILRTHVMRPTWHFVTPDDIRWMLELTAPRVKTAIAHYFRLFDLDEALFQKSNAVFVKALQGGKQLTRLELGSALEQVGIEARGQRLAHIVFRAELDGIVCSGPRRGKQFTYMLLDERAPQARTLPRDEALGELTRRYFTSHGPAQMHDFAWWSGLTIADVKRGLEISKQHLVQEENNSKTYWRATNLPETKHPPQTAYLLPPFDEFTVAYKDRSPIIDPGYVEKEAATILDGVIILNCRAMGNWKQRINKGVLSIELMPSRHFSPAESNAVALAAQRLGDFLELPVEME